MNLFLNKFKSHSVVPIAFKLSLNMHSSTFNLDQRAVNPSLCPLFNKWEFIIFKSQLSTDMNSQSPSLSFIKVESLMLVVLV